MLSRIKRNKAILSWSIYDFANQPFTTVIVTFIYSSFFTQVIAPDQQTGVFLWANAVAIVAVSVAFLSPLLGAIADNSGYRKFFFISSTWLCVLFTCLLFFPEAGDVYLALLIFIIANIAFEMGTVFYNSYLIDLSDDKNIGRISGFSWGLGFIGGVLVLFLCYLFITAGRLDPGAFYLSFENSSVPIRRTNILVALWLFVFSIPTFIFISDRKRDKWKNTYIKDSFISVAHTFRTVKEHKTIFKFLIARLFYNDGLITIFALGGIYAVGSIGFDVKEVFLLAIVLNISAAIGSFVFGILEYRIGVRTVINITLLTLIVATFIAFFAPETTFSKQLFWFAGILIGLMVGPNQSSSRSLMSRLTPSVRKNEFFGFYALTGKATSFLGPLLYGLVAKLYSQQLALCVVIVFFVIGFILFNKLQIPDEGNKEIM